MEGSKFKEMYAPTIVLLLIVLISTGLLTATYNVTKPTIDAINAQRAAEARMAVLPDADDFTEVEGLELLTGVSEVYSANNGTGYVVTVANQGFGGNVEVMVGVGSDGAVTGVSVLDHAETPGLGTNALTDSFIESRFIGKTAVATTGKRAGEIPGDSVDVYTGATYSSRAMINNVAVALAQVAEIA